MRYFIVIGSPDNHSGLECAIDCELQIGDYAEMWHGEHTIEDNKEGELVIITHRMFIAAIDVNFFIFYAKRVNN
ncbi:MAG: hypothetical protein JXQ96_14835 [Cyclobacteriaceae bacterium]